MNNPLPRRAFLKQTARAAAIAGLSGCGPLLQGCFSKKQFDWVIKSGWVYDGLGGPPVQTDVAIRRLKDPELDSKLRAHLASQEEKIGSGDKILLSPLPSEKNRHLQGKTVLEAAGQMGKKPYDLMRDLLIEEKKMVGMIAFMMDEDNLTKVLAHPLVGVGCDGSAVAPYGILSRGRPHPRNYGTFPRILRKYVREEKIVPAGSLRKRPSGMT